MSQEKTTVESSVVAVYHDQKAAEHALRQLHEAGFATSDLSIVGRDFQMSEQPIGFISAGDYASAGAAAGTGLADYSAYAWARPSSFYRAWAPS